jgi:Uri superfamily endonuclease
MSERSIYLRDQADKCRWHADHMSDASTQAELRNLAADYILRAVAIERGKPR